MSKWQDKVKEIIYLLENSDMNELDITFWGGRRFRVVKSPGITTGLASASPTVVSGATTTAESLTETMGSESILGEQIISPMPGTFYRSPSPDSDSFVKEGDQIIKGDTLCIIEAMKIMNEIESEINGVVKKILIEDGKPVEYNQPLFIVEPNG
ncbi:MAG: acetyl-CoA carboxylase biotin carboxyl carrier protein [Candidatus Marinimicrobia bacterium]|nr:acetyl-CoA carboxylase biotin carboxyl carrier protein [Candidatus Neomarinimicrobiota bacterium]